MFGLLENQKSHLGATYPWRLITGHIAPSPYHQMQKHKLRTRIHPPGCNANHGNTDYSKLRWLVEAPK